MAYSPITAIPLILTALALVILAITLTLKRASNAANSKGLQLATGVVAGWLCGLPIFFYLFGWLGNSIWPSYPQIRRGQLASSWCGPLLLWPKVIRTDVWQTIV